MCFKPNVKKAILVKKTTGFGFLLNISSVIYTQLHEPNQLEVSKLFVAEVRIRPYFSVVKYTFIII